MEQRDTEQRWNSRTLRNSGETMVDLGIPMEHQRNTNGTPRNKGSIQNEEQL